MEYKAPSASQPVSWITKQHQTIKSTIVHVLRFYLFHTFHTFYGQLTTGPKSTFPQTFPFLCQILAGIDESPARAKLAHPSQERISLPP